VNLKRKHFVPEASQSRASSRCTAIFQQQMVAAQAAGAGREQQPLQGRQQQGSAGAAQKPAAGRARPQKEGADGRGRQAKGFKALQARKALEKRSAVQVSYFGANPHA
jgi:hypothetical protein